ncbi:MAG: 30S ribosomal protein S3 [Candidatus Woesearchaeota archaeon]
MIVRKVIDQKIKEFEIQEYIQDNLKRVGLSHIKLQMTPLGEKIIIFASRPGLIVGRKGQSIRKLTLALKKKFNLENPQIEINEIEKINLDANIVAERIVNSLEKFGPMRFKAIGHKSMADVMNAGALGVEILISGKIPSTRAKRWRFYQGYLKKSGNVAVIGVRTSYKVAQLKSGSIGIQVRIMPPDTFLPDFVALKSDLSEFMPKAQQDAEKEAVSEEDKGDEKEKSTTKKKPAKKRAKKSPAKEDKEPKSEQEEHTN